MESGFPRETDGRLLLDEDDRLEAIESGKGPRSGLLGQDDRRPTTGVAKGEGPLEAEVLDGRGDIVGESRPMELAVRWWLGAAMGTQVDGPAMVTIGQLRGQRGEDGGTEAGGVEQDQVTPRPTEVVGGDTNAVMCGHPRHRVEVRPRAPSFGTHRRHGSRRSGARSRANVHPAGRSA